ncbi:MAG TPA: hypothetical protein VJH22_00010 [Candidatus Nanoarchaeia archaeon]|nr:hypothetical protein [Candidatus Nanoarchaeia archaeon]
MQSQVRKESKKVKQADLHPSIKHEYADLKGLYHDLDEVSREMHEERKVLEELKQKKTKTKGF